MDFLNSFPTVEGFSKFENRSSLDLGFKFLCLEDNLQVGVSVTDILKMNENKSVEKYPTYSYKQQIYNDMRGVSVSVSYKFGNNKVKVRDNKVPEVESERL